MVSGAMILGAGLGTRLRPLTDLCAKPMVPVGDAPAVAHALAQVRLVGATRIAVNVHHRPDDLRAWAEAEGVSVSHEPILLGTAGGIHGARPLLGDGEVLVWNGDILSDLDPGALVAAHDAAATLAVLRRPAGKGTVGIGDGGRVVRLRGETFGEERAGGEYLGIHVMSRALRALLPAMGGLVEDVWLPALRRGERLATFATDASFLDIGSVAHYLAANRAWLAARGLSSWAHPTAVVSADIQGSVIGAHAVVEADARDSVVWPRARVHSACKSVVVTT